MFGALASAIIWMAPLLVGHDVALRWIQSEGASACIGDRELAAAVTARLGGASNHGRARIVISGDIAPAGSGWTAAIRTEDDHGGVLGQRDLHESSSDCRAIDDKLVLVIALIIDPDLLDETPVPTVTKPAAVIVPREPWRFGAGVAALASRGMLPGFGFGTAVVAMISPPHVWPIE
ncbi:MAG TPA: hypothetical protein VFQ65_20980, partial [Kofleriaceae bacterium]|nr:hypothetical protein [Kofleriaceae bacterium]